MSNGSVKMRDVLKQAAGNGASIRGVIGKNLAKMLENDNDGRRAVRGGDRVHGRMQEKSSDIGRKKGKQQKNVTTKDPDSASQSDDESAGVGISSVSVSPPPSLHTPPNSGLFFNFRSIFQFQVHFSISGPFFIFNCFF